MTNCSECIHNVICGTADNCIFCKHLDSEWHCKQCCNQTNNWFECEYFRADISGVKAKPLKDHKCPRCKYQFKEESAFCPNCGQAMDFTGE